MSEIQELLTVVRAREERIDQQIAELRGLAGMNGAGNMHQIVMQPPDSGERAVHRVEKANYMLVGLFVGLLIGGWALLDRLSADARDLKREQQRTADYQAMLWQRYPELRPENLKPKEEKKP